MEAYGLNTIAGYSTYLRTSQLVPNASVTFSVTDPDGESTSLSAITNQNGIAQTELSDYFTRTSGDYSVSVKYENDSNYGKVGFFEVYSGEVSQSNSLVSPTEQVVRSYDEDSTIKVKLSDDYGNPIEDHLVKLISSSSYDFVTSPSQYTGSNGEITFEVSSDEKGTVTYSIYDVTADVVLDSRSRIVYFTDSEYVFVNDVPEKYIYAATGSPSSAIDSFEFDSVPELIGVGESITFDLIAKDALDQEVTNYEGTVRFSVVTDNSFFASLPEDYTFTTSDLGSHTFSLAMSFQQAGTYTIEARDLDEITVSGEYDFIVTEGSNLSASTIKITNPTSGTYSNNIQVISGSAPAGSALKIFDNDVELASLVANAAGQFSYTTSALSDGNHSFYVATVNEVGTITGTSESVSVIVDTSGPEVAQIVLDPTGEVDPGAIITAKIYTSDDLSQAAILFQNSIYETVHNTGGYYEGSFAAPIEFGEYPVGVVIVDQLGNENKVENLATVNVGVLSGLNAEALGDVNGLTAVSSDHRVTLEWNPMQTLGNLITNYRVYYGLTPNQLTEAVDTFTNSTTWYLPNLKNDVEYYFAVIAVDEKGNVSEHFSNIVSSTPGPDIVEVASPEVTMGTAGEDALGEMDRDPSEAGPEIKWLVLCSLLGGMFYMFVRKQKEAL
ncbi:MAG: fibronectin type III domain-containing protein [Nitrospirota bacterium]